MAKHLENYAEKYDHLPFEKTQVLYRRRSVIQEIEHIKPKHLLEIGCGLCPIFTDTDPSINVTLVEASPAFVENAQKLAEETSRNIKVHCCMGEDYDSNGEDFDMIILSGVLHEVPDPQKLLAAIRKCCGPNTVLHINVPNARSVHRLLAYSMGMIDRPDAASPTQKAFHHRGTVYDKLSLSQELEAAGFEVSKYGTSFIKPFTHKQMQDLQDNNFLTQDMLEGFYRLIEYMPDYGSELWVNACLRVK